ncbi:hypothetical protein RB653_000144 [Dictyostelium firmibasis]|uniref:Uncharacterized protein n=1 Tax=Dictyostelium firmibasis TaxID=79012 RepID=A0AAN7YVP3_9MYCE
MFLPMDEIVKKLDELHIECKHNDIIKFINEQEDQDNVSKNVEINWRLARAYYNQSDIEENKDVKLKYIQTSLEIINKFILTNEHPDLYKWWAISTSGLGEYLGAREKIGNAPKIKEYGLKSLELRPKDPVTLFLLGRWSYSVASISWIEKTVANTLFGTVPNATYQEALDYFLGSYEIEPNMIRCVVSIADCYYQLGQHERAKDNVILFCKIKDIDPGFVLINGIKYRIFGDESLDQEIIYDFFQTKPVYLNKKENRIKDIVVSRECKYVDLVYTWVNGSDPDHLRARIKASNITNEFMFSTSSSYRDIGTLKYSIRSVRQYAPWIKNIFIITADQIPTWFDTENPDNVKFIFHKNLYRNISDLPTFNSNSIESNFWNLPVEVSNCFLYLNDDIFFSRPVNQNEYFDENFKQSVLLSESAMERKSEIKYENYEKSILFTNRALASIWGQDRKRKMPAHGIQVFNRKTWYKIQEDFGNGLEITSANQFRNFTDFQISHLYIQFAIRYFKPIVNLTPDVLYILLNNENFDEKLQLVKTSNDINTICLNDGLEFIDDELQKKVDDTFNYLFPIPSPFEKMT